MGKWVLINETAYKSVRIKLFSLLQYHCPITRFRMSAPAAYKLRVDMEKDALTKLFCRRKPLDVAGKISAVDCELNFIQLALCSCWRWFKAGKAI
ncbi:hypothetical protein RvVAR0630_18390 [Agrobacterium vitis]|nr:hypothetical protein RvVAR0630_18390 [Agrobacterium vitis]